jgi:C-terminal processing protease CtpA/Prc
MLKSEPPEFAEARLDSLYEAAPAKDEDRSDSLPTVEIDLDRAHTRWQRVYLLAADQSELVQTPDGEYWLFVADLPGGRNIWRVPVDPDSDDKPLQLTSGSKAKSGLAVAKDGKRIYYLEDGRIGTVTIDGKEQKQLSFTADYDYHPARRHEQKLTEVWRMLGNYFYDPALHGAAWDSLHDQFAAILPHIELDEELRDLLREFLGTLNASHLNIYGGRPELPTAKQSGYLGVEFDAPALRSGIYRIGTIYAQGPIAEADAAMDTGDTLVAVNGDTLVNRSNLDSLLAGTIGERVQLTFRGASGLQTAAVKPVSKSRHNDLRYEHWVESRRGYVDSVSEGRLGYLHIRAMDQRALDRFKRELADQTANYEGLVIDVRFNGGGWIAVHLLGMLEREPFVLRNFRGYGTVSENKSRSYAVEKPMILLINHFSASNSEIFAEGWRTLNLGKIVGYPTSAAVIGTAAYRLIDGTICRRPSWGAYTLSMENLEGNGRVPDIQLFNTQHDWLSNRDPQLQRAVEELLAELR